jgi:V-type H+-transporting ATPase subunit H
MVENDSVGVYAMLLDLIENISHEKSLMSYVVPTLEAIISENQKQFKQFLRAITPQVVPKLKAIMFIDGYETCVYEACAKIATMVIAEEG